MIKREKWPLEMKSKAREGNKITCKGKVVGKITRVLTWFNMQQEPIFLTVDMDIKGIDLHRNHKLEVLEVPKEETTDLVKAAEAHAEQYMKPLEAGDEGECHSSE